MAALSRRKPEPNRANDPTAQRHGQQRPQHFSTQLNHAVADNHSGADHDRPANDDAASHDHDDGTTNNHPTADHDDDGTTDNDPSTDDNATPHHNDHGAADDNSATHHHGGPNHHDRATDHDAGPVRLHYPDRRGTLRRRCGIAGDNLGRAHSKFARMPLNICHSKFPCASPARTRA